MSTQDNLDQEHGDAPSSQPWPAMSLYEVRDRLCAPGGRFEMETVMIRGIPTRTWKNAPTNLPTLARLARMGYGDRLITIFEDERVTYEAWFRASAALAEEFIRLGVGKGDRIALAMRNLPEWPVTFFAATSIGAIMVPLNGWWTGQELAYGLENSGTKVLVCDEERWERIAPHMPELTSIEAVLVSRSGAPLNQPSARKLESVIGRPNDYQSLPDRDFPAIDVHPDDDATILYTSGTTGRPKGAVGSHRNLMTNILSSGYAAASAVLRMGEELPTTPPDPKTVLTVIPMFHATACSAVMMGTVAGGNTMVYMYKWDPLEALKLIERERINSTGGVPTIAWQLLEHPDRDKYDISSLETVSYGGAPSAPELVRKINSDFKAMPGNGWGMTETTATVTNHIGPDYLNRPDSCGPAVAVADVKIMSEDGERPVPTGDIGELWARGPMVVRGYWNNPAASAATFIDGWVRTGDLARLDEEGFCYIVDRAKDMVIRGGENIYSIEIENVLYEHPAVMDAAVIGIPHPTLGEEPAAVVHLAPNMDATEDELKEWVRSQLAAFKVPVKFLFLRETLPRNANGKILKKDLKELFEDAN